MPTVRTKQGVELNYEIDDHTDEWRNAPVLILQHGYGRSSRFWYSWVPTLSRHFRVVRPDLRGLGRSSTAFDLERDLSVDAYLGDLLTVFDAVGADRVHYCGESLGGIIGIALAGTYPDRIRTLSLVSAPLYLNDKTKQTFAFDHPSWEDALRAMGSEGWSRATNTAFRFPPGTDPGLMDWYAKEMGKSKVEVLIAMTRLASKADVRPYLGKITAPVLSLYPSNGTTASTDQEKILLENVRNIRGVRLPTPYHSLMTIAPELCATQVLHFAALHDGVAVR